MYGTYRRYLVLCSLLLCSQRLNLGYLTIALLMIWYLRGVFSIAFQIHIAGKIQASKVLLLGLLTCKVIVQPNQDTFFLRASFLNKFLFYSLTFKAITLQMDEFKKLIQSFPNLLEKAESEVNINSNISYLYE